MLNLPFLLSFATLLAITAACGGDGAGKGDETDDDVDDAGPAGTDGKPEDDEAEEGKPAGEDQGTSEDDGRFADAPDAPRCEVSDAEMLFEHKTKVHAVAVTETQLLFGANDGLYVMAKDGSTEPTRLYEGTVLKLGNVGKDVYFSDDFTTRMVNPTILENEGKPRELPFAGTEFVSDGTRMYAFDPPVFCGDSTSSTVDVFDMTNQMGKVEFPCLRTATGLAGNVYTVSEVKEERRIMKNAAGGQAAELVAGDFDELIAATPTHVYSVVTSVFPSQYLVRVPVAGGELEILSGSHAFNSMASDGRDVYFSDLEHSCTYKFDSASEKLVPFTSGGLVEQMAFDDAYVYFASFEGTIKRAKR